MKTHLFFFNRLWLLCMAMFSVQCLFGQQITVKGTVYDSGKHPLPGAMVSIKHSTINTASNEMGKYSIKTRIGDTLRFSFIGLEPQEFAVKDSILDVILPESKDSLQEVVVTGGPPANREMHFQAAMTRVFDASAPMMQEEYQHFQSNGFRAALEHPLSTFSIDVDAASYSNMRRYINNGTLPPKDAIRVEELINYFHYDYPAPRGNEPVNIITEVSEAPWNKNHRLVHIGIKAKDIATKNLPASNLVFLIDVSGSMYSQNKLPLLKSSLKLLVQQLRPEDRVAIVTYANQTREVLPSTPGDRKATILQAIEGLEANGGTNGGDGIRHAYRLAGQHFMPNGNNRIILATDGDFNIGDCTPEALENLISEKRESGIYLSVLGFGMGNYKDNRAQVLAEKGNGNHAYIDNLMEAKKVLVNEFGGTLFTVAKDVKIQVEFNPAKVQAYRLIGYESRLLADKDFNDDTKDAGEMGAGHTVTALYEVIPVGIESPVWPNTDPLKYQQTQPEKRTKLTNSPELLTVKLRYKEPTSSLSKKIETAVTDKHLPLSKTSDNFRFSAAVAGFGMLLQNSPYKNTLTYQDVLQLARPSIGQDPEGYRQEFIRLVETTNLLKQ